MASQGAGKDVAVQARGISAEARSATQPLAHDGRTTAAWVSSGIALVGFVIAGVGFILPGISWPVVGGGLAVVIAGAIVGGVLRKLGLGVRES